MCVNGIFSIAMNLNMGPALFVSIVRSCLQLAAFGYMLVPIFNAQHWAPVSFHSSSSSWIHIETFFCLLQVILFAMFMIVLGAREAFVRPQYTYKDIFWHLCATLTFSCFFLTMFGTALCIMVVPFWNPQYFIPILALLIGNSNCTNTVGLVCLFSTFVCISNFVSNFFFLFQDTCLSHFKEGREQIEALLIRGATKWEAR
jgi:putative ABC transport system permease protein